MYSHAGERRAIAGQLVAALQKYETDLLPLARGYDPERFASLSQQFEELRLHAVTLPELSEPWVNVLISRAEMTYTLFKAQQGGRDQPHDAAFLAKHRLAVRGLADACARLIR